MNKQYFKYEDFSDINISDDTKRFSSRWTLSHNIPDFIDSLKLQRLLNAGYSCHIQHFDKTLLRPYWTIELGVASLKTITYTALSDQEVIDIFNNFYDMFI